MISPQHQALPAPLCSQSAPDSSKTMQTNLEVLCNLSTHAPSLDSLHVQVDVWPADGFAQDVLALADGEVGCRLHWGEVRHLPSARQGALLSGWNAGLMQLSRTQEVCN